MRRMTSSAFAGVLLAASAAAPVIPAMSTQTVRASRPTCRRSCPRRPWLQRRERLDNALRSAPMDAAAAVQGIVLRHTGKPLDTRECASQLGAYTLIVRTHD